LLTEIPMIGGLRKWRADEVSFLLLMSNFCRGLVGLRVLAYLPPSSYSPKKVSVHVAPMLLYSTVFNRLLEMYRTRPNASR